MNVSMMNNRIVFTGPPCSGKSSVINELKKQGVVIISEVARAAIAFFQEYEQEKLPTNNHEFFQNYVETQQLRNYIENSIGLFDRGLVDEIAYRKFFGMAENPNLIMNSTLYKYDKVIFFPYWDEIYQNDEQRKETKEQAMLQEKLLIEAYTNAGYELIYVPKTTIEDRCKIIQTLWNLE